MGGEYWRRRFYPCLGVICKDFYLLPSALLILNLQELPSTDGATGANINTPNHKLIAVLHSAHGVHDVNTVVWCPREGFEDLLATSGDDGAVRVWKVKSP